MPDQWIVVDLDLKQAICQRDTKKLALEWARDQLVTGKPFLRLMVVKLPKEMPRNGA